MHVCPILRLKLFTPFTLYSLTPPEPEDGLDEYFQSRVEPFTVEQRKAIQKFLDAYAVILPSEFEDSLPKATRFWSQYA